MNKPEKKYRSGVISLTVWKNVRTVDEKEVEYYSFVLEKSYKSGEEWKTTSSYSEYDLLKIAELVRLAYVDYGVNVE